ncbi:MAG: hypothetical protein AAF495_00330 [Pseudomonadota bacterium]
MMSNRFPLAACCLVIALLILAPGRLAAAPILEFEFLGSGQTFGPTDQVLIQARITNNGTDPLVDAIGFGGVTVPDQITDQYDDLFPPGINPTPPGPDLLTLNPGNSVTWDFALYDPFPDGGNQGDPVQPGTYIFPSENIFAQFLVFEPEFGFIPVNTQSAADFVWIVPGGPVAVVEPSSLGMFVISLLLLGAVVRTVPVPRA